MVSKWYTYHIMRRITFKKITLNVSKKQHEIFQLLAQEEQLPYSELIRRALDEYIERRYPDVSHDKD